jgi:hypothetical protein
MILATPSPLTVVVSPFFQAYFPALPGIQALNDTTFDPDLYGQQLHEAFGFNAMFAWNSNMTLTDVFTPRLDASV